MSDNTGSDLVPRKPTLGDRMREVANQLRQEKAIQIKATSRILGAAAQMSQNHDRLIDEVVVMVEDDLDRAAQAASATPYTVEVLKERFASFKEAKTQLGVKATSWTTLVDKLNAQHSPSASMPPQPANPPPQAQDVLTQRLDSIEQEMRSMRREIHQILTLLERLV
ncbi:hypothetical protein [Leptolyngbya sp. CCY15150]|uniref:hypothetical protein n=1 Tax=Leptolyngbya sp. CCY15150 TaxID=2767772 RepID=UPI00194E408C|nr:hypothetical protein [Leptolyngbya sp. CCY15150]